VAKKTKNLTKNIARKKQLKKASSRSGAAGDRIRIIDPTPKAHSSISRFAPSRMTSFVPKRVRKITQKRSVRAVLALTVVSFIAANVWLFWGIPLSTELTQSEAVSTKIYDRNGNLFYEIFADKKRTPISLDEIPDHVVDATIAIEDKDFYKHPGFSVAGIARALYKNTFQQKFEGGSTLTQQLVKNAYLTPDRTVRRKAQELILALLVEARHSKEDILERYLNEIPYGSTAYGIESASELYFGKSARELSLAEAALLAGLPAAPSRYSPFGSRPEFAKERQRRVLSRMVEDGYISEVEANEAREEELVYAEPEDFRAPHFALWIKEQLAERYGETVVEQGGLRVTTTLDLELQEFAQEAVADEVAKLENLDVGNGAAFVVKPNTGEILAMVGSKDYFAEDEDGKVNIIFALRQPGSSIKPLNYVMAIANKKITASTAIADTPTCFSVVGQEPYCPKNYDGEFHGATQIRFALGNSYNIPAVRVLALNGIKEFTEFAQSMGITTFTDPSRYGLSLTLGGGEIRPYDMAVAFSTLANRGVRKDLSAFVKVEDWRGKVLYEKEAPEDVEGIRVIDPEPAFIISHILHDNNARSAAFGTGSYLNVSGHPEVSVKTGTTNDLRDNWTIGYTEQALVVTWVGNNDNSPMSGAVSGVSGASPIWNRIIKEVLNKAEEGFYDENENGHAWPQQPADVVGASVCANTGALPNDQTPDCPTRFEYFLEGTVPEKGAFRQDVLVFNDTGMVANAEALPEQVHPENHLMLEDPLGTLICLDCAGPMPETTVRYPIKQ
jgi:penicillin-binding protein 1C